MVKRAVKIGVKAVAYMTLGLIFLILILMAILHGIAQGVYVAMVANYKTRKISS